MREVFVSCNRLALDAQSETRATDYVRLKLAGLEDAPCHLAVFVEPDPDRGAASVG